MTMEEDLILFVVPEDEDGTPIEFPLSYLLNENFAFHENKEENVKDLNELIQAIAEYRDNL